jgi:hypothetical protein
MGQTGHKSAQIFPCGLDDSLREIRNWSKDDVFLLTADRRGKMRKMILDQSSVRPLYV